MQLIVGQRGFRSNTGVRHRAGRAGRLSRPLDLWCLQTTRGAGEVGVEKRKVFVALSWLWVSEDPALLPSAYKDTPLISSLTSPGRMWGLTHRAANSGARIHWKWFLGWGAFRDCALDLKLWCMITMRPCPEVRILPVSFSQGSLFYEECRAMQMRICTGFFKECIVNNLAPYTFFSLCPAKKMTWKLSFSKKLHSILCCVWGERIRLWKQLGQRRWPWCCQGWHWAAGRWASLQRTLSLRQSRLYVNASALSIFVENIWFY